MGVSFSSSRSTAKLERLAAFGAEQRVGGGVDRLRQPRPDVALAASARRLRQIERQAGRGRREEGGRIEHDASDRVPCQRIQVSCTMSSASEALPSIR